MRVFKTKRFSRDARKAGLTDKELRKAVDRLVAGSIDADLGAHLVKQRISQGSGGRAGSYRAIIVHKIKDRIVFVHLFAKSSKANLSDDELDIYRDLAHVLVGLDVTHITALLSAGEWVEVEHG
ncbi:type II toxin-antitoxin system RelE/ParE family toxin [Mangrovicella endophytica]|uniref:type II toxin-antitoxin system RelE/ParE family toxin n=1 Tax=Mangrovicella endophytica TaxID=2066697 RepID=UPI000C9EA379|nr:type II toxin-antitoxin system RelE/ParE family toxin [Mangrovicella endophytica]